MTTINKIQITPNAFVRISKSVDCEIYYTQLVVNKGETGCRIKSYSSLKSALRAANKIAKEY